MKRLLILPLMMFSFFACKKEDSSSTPAPIEPQLVFKIKMDSTQQRLDGFGNPAIMPAGHAGQSPLFDYISAHYFELTKDSLTQIGAGSVLDKGTETTAGGDKAIDFEKSVRVKDGEVILKVPLKNVTAATFKYLRMSVSYQEYQVKYRATVNSVDYNLTGRLASYIGYNTYIKSYSLNGQSFTVNGNRKQGFWAFQTTTSVDTGQAAGTTVPNPISKSSPIPAGSCLVTAKFDQPLVITGTETSDVTVEISLSNNKSFEWEDGNSNNIWEPLLGEKVVDMGIRGMQARRK